MKVRATRLGYYNHRRRREGEIFELADEKLFSNRWMEKLEEETPPAKPKPKKEKEVSQASSEEVI